MASGRQVKRLLAELAPDGAWAGDLAELRALLVLPRDAPRLTARSNRPRRRRRSGLPADRDSDR
jgi:hypothetical protein